jgi:phosphoenolpyruvate carboxykinase (ATP)
LRNASVPVLYEQAIAYERGTAITASGALATDSGAKKGRSPKDKRIVEESSSVEDIWVTFKLLRKVGPS